MCLLFDNLTFIVWMYRCLTISTTKARRLLSRTGSCCLYPTLPSGPLYPWQHGVWPVSSSVPQQTPGLGLCILSYLISWTFCFTLGFFKTGFLLHTFEDFYSLVFVLTILNAFCNENVLKFGHSETEKKITNFCYIMCLIHVHQIYRHIHASLTLCIENTEHLSWI